MNCESCFAEWSIQFSGDRTVKFCPFCGEKIIEKEPERFSDLIECFKYLKGKYGYTIFFDKKRILSLVSDFMPELVVEARILRIVLDSGVYKQLFDKNGNFIDLNIDKTKYALINDYGLAEKWSNESIDWIAKTFALSETKDLSDTQNTNNTKQVPPLNEETTTITSAQKKHGIVKGTDFRGNYVYQGEINDQGIPDGVGELTYAKGDIFVGDFLNGKMDGRVKWITDSGMIFEGLFEKGKQAEGHGVLTEKNGDVYEGHFRKGLRKDGVIIHRINGKATPVKERYSNGHFLEKCNN